MPRYSQDTRDAIVLEYQSGVKTCEICERHGMSDTGVRNVLRASGIVPNHGQERIPRAEIDEMVSLYAGGMSINDIARRVNRSSQTVHKAIRRSGISVRPQRKPHKLSTEDSEKLVRRYVDERATYDDLCSEFDVSSTVVARTLREAGVVPRVGWVKYRTREWTDRKGRIHLFKSSWELAYAGHLDSLGVDWEYEPVRLGLVECRVYTPDFGIYQDGSLVRLVEVKGWLDERTIARMAEVRVRYPSLVVEFVGPAQMAALGLAEGKYMNHHMTNHVFRLQQKFSSTTA